MTDSNRKTGLVIESLPNATFRVRTEDGAEYICYLAGRMKINKIAVAVGNYVDFDVDPYGGKATNRIVKRK